jgi:hypothetical protein
MVEKISLGSLEPYALILAHGDDEIGAIPIVLRNQPTLVCYLTNGSGIGQSNLSEKREHEIRRSWGILSSDLEIMNFGGNFEIPDGALHASLTKNHLEILKDAIANSGVKSIVTTHAEGGHQDHDTSFMVSQYLSLILKIDLFSFPLYCQSSVSKKLYRVMGLPGLGSKCEIKSLRIRIRSFVLAIELMLNYRSQWRTWIGLGLPLLFAMIRRYQFIKPSFVSLTSYPAANSLFYESRGRADRVTVTSHWLKIGIISNKGS